MEEDRERGEFEDVVKKKFLTSVKRCSNGQYASVVTESMWVVWKARAELDGHG